MHVDGFVNKGISKCVIFFIVGFLCWLF